MLLRKALDLNNSVVAMDVRTINGSDLSTFSIIVPTYNRPKSLKRCLESLQRLDYPLDKFECIIVNDGGMMEDNGWPLERMAEKTPGFQFRIVQQPNGGPASARNRGASQAKYEYLAFTDDDCAPEPGWLRGFMVAFREQPLALLGGRYCNALPEDHGAAATQIVNDVGYARAIARGRGCGPGDAWLFVTANLAVPRKQFLEVGGFDASFPLAAGEDYDFCHRYQHHGLPGGYCDAAVVNHYHPMTLRQFWRQHFGYGRGLLQFRRLASERMGGVAERNYASFQMALLRHCMRKLSSYRNWVDVGYVAISQMATVSGALMESCSSRTRKSSRQRSRSNRTTATDE